MPRLIVGSFSRLRLRQLAARLPWDVFVSIDAHAITRGGILICFTRAEFFVFFTLAVRAGGVVSRKNLIDALYCDDPGGGPNQPEEQIYKAIYGIRHKLFSIPEISIHAESRRGWYLEIKEATIYGAQEYGRKFDGP